MVKGLLPERPHCGSELELFFVWIIFSPTKFKIYGILCVKKKEWNINCAHWAEVFCCYYQQNSRMKLFRILTNTWFWFTQSYCVIFHKNCSRCLTRHKRQTPTEFNFLRRFVLLLFHSFFLYSLEASFHVRMINRNERVQFGIFSNILENPKKKNELERFEEHRTECELDGDTSPSRSCSTI